MNTVLPCLMRNIAKCGFKDRSHRLGQMGKGSTVTTSMDHKGHKREIHVFGIHLRLARLSSSGIGHRLGGNHAREIHLTIKNNDDVI